jgi:predicted transcriptional regulator
MLDLADDPSQLELEENVTMKSVSSGKRGRPRLPNMWSRVINVDAVSSNLIVPYPIAHDIEEAVAFKTQLQSKRPKAWKPLFYSKEFLADHSTFELEDFKISDHKLNKLGVQVSRARQMFTERARVSAHDTDSDLKAALEETSLHVATVAARGSASTARHTTARAGTFKEPVPIDSRQRSRKRVKLTTLQKIRIVHQVMHLKHSQTDVAREYRVTKSAISSLVSKARHNKEFLEEILFEHNRKESLRMVTRDIITSMNQEYQFLDSIKTVQKCLKRQHKLKVKPWTIRDIMRNDLGMSFKKVTALAWTANS